MKAPAGGIIDRLAGGPISWGVCEVPGWGVMLPRDRVLSEMRGLGLKASELGALGYLGTDPQEIRELLLAVFPWRRGRFRAPRPARLERQGTSRARR